MLPQISGRECIKALSKIGFTAVRQKGSHIIVVRDDPFASVTIPDHRELAPGTLRSIIKSAGCSVAEFVSLL